MTSEILARVKSTQDVRIIILKPPMGSIVP